MVGLSAIDVRLRRADRGPRSDGDGLDGAQRGQSLLEPVPPRPVDRAAQGWRAGVVDEPAGHVDEPGAHGGGHGALTHGGGPADRRCPTDEIVGEDRALEPGGQALLAWEFPDGTCARPAPAFRSRMSSSTWPTSWRWQPMRYVMIHRRRTWTSSLQRRCGGGVRRVIRPVHGTGSTPGPRRRPCRTLGRSVSVPTLYVGRVLHTREMFVMPCWVPRRDQPVRSACGPLMFTDLGCVLLGSQKGFRSGRPGRHRLSTAWSTAARRRTASCGEPCSSGSFEAKVDAVAGLSAPVRDLLQWGWTPNP